MNNNQIGYDMIYLCNCAINEIQLDEERIMEMNLEKIYEISRFHSTCFAVYTALERTAAFVENCPLDLQKRWKQDKEMAVRRSLMFDIEREQITSLLEKEGIWYMPLKGILLKNYYPHPAMRYMCDNDILYDRSRRKRVRDIMLERGYTVTCYGNGHDDEYMKPPFYNFEMHVDLFDYSNGDRFPEYYGNVKERLLKEKDGKYRYCFKDEDFYIYFLAHAYKHYEEYGGNGIRFLMDIYLYLKKKKELLDWNYIEKELRKLQISEFAVNVQTIALCIFDKEFLAGTLALTDEIRESLDYILKSGTFGIDDNIVRNSLKRQGEKTSKSRYVRGRIFPDKNFVRTYYPFVYRHMWIYPFFIVFRFFRGITVKGKKIMRELRALKKL